MAKGLCLCGQPSREGQRYCKACHAAATRKWRKNHQITDEERIRSNCRSYLNVYVKKGYVKKGPCIFCGITERIEGHHEDYSKPLEVIWICRGHHVLVTRGLLDIPKEILDKVAQRITV